MAEPTLERTVRFRATHHYARADWSEERNREAFGPVASPHAHEWAVTVTVQGPIDRHGFIVDLPELDRRLLGVLEGWDDADLNQVSPEMRPGVLQPTTESIARWIWERLASRIPGPGRLVRVRVAESAHLAAEYSG